MAFFWIQLQLADGTASRWLSSREAQRLIDKGDAVRIKRKARQGYEVVRLRPVPEASKSPSSTPALTFADTEMLAGAREAAPFRLANLRAKQLHFQPIQLPVVYVSV